MVLYTLLAMGIFCGIAGADAGTAFLYQGHLKLHGVPLEGQADFECTLWDEPDAGTQVGSLVSKTGISVAGGLFELELDFGAAAFSGKPRWLAIAVRHPSGSGLYEPILPRQPIANSPYSIHTRGVYVDSDENVGIGTTTPQARVDVLSPSAPDFREPIVRTSVDDAPNDFFMIANSTRLDGQYLPLLWGHNENDDSGSLQIAATTDAAHENSSNAMMVFNTMESDGSLLLAPINGRPLFQWTNYLTPLMTLTSAGRLGIGTTTPQTKLHLGLASNARDGIFLGKSETGHGTRLSVRGTNNQIFGVDIDPNSLSGFEQFEVTFNGGGPIFVVDDDGEVGIGTTNPQVPLHVDGGNDATPSSGGFIQIGPTSGANLVIDSNEIMARNNGSASTLFINNDGGTVQFGGAIDIGYTTVNSISPGSSGAVSCPSGTKLLGGGCAADSHEIQNSHPSFSGTTWQCESDGGRVISYAICAKVR